jgi:hypothetical protein
MKTKKIQQKQPQQTTTNENENGNESEEFAVAHFVNRLFSWAQMPRPTHYYGIGHAANPTQPQPHVSTANATTTHSAATSIGGSVGASGAFGAASACPQSYSYLLKPTFTFSKDDPCMQPQIKTNLVQIACTPVDLEPSFHLPVGMFHIT